MSNIDRRGLCAGQRTRTACLGSIASATAALLIPATAAQAQVTPPTRGELIPPDERRTQPPVRLTVDGDFERTPCALDRPEYSDIRFILGGAEFVGLERVPRLNLEETYRSYVGREVPISTLCDIRASANATLRRAGYLATVEIPEQNLSDGVPEFRVVFGRLTALRVRGDVGPSEALIARYLNKLTEQTVFNSKQAERYLLLANDVPGLDIRLSLRPAAGGMPGDLVGEVAVVRQAGVIDANIQNLGSQAIGRFNGLLRAEVYDVTGLGDRTSLAVFSTLDFAEQQTVQLSHDFRIGSEGLRVGTQATYSVSDPDFDLPGFAVESETLLANVFASYPIERTRQSSIFADIGFEYVDQDVDINDVALTEDRVRTVFARFSGEWTDQASVQRTNGFTPFEPKVRLRYGVEVRQGLDVFSASPDCRVSPLSCVIGGKAPPSRIEANPTPFLIRYDAGVEVRLDPLITFSLEGEAQVASDPVPAFEEFAAGNYAIGRGFDPGAVLGDSGIAGSLEVRYGSLAPKDIDAVAVQPFVFTDVAYAWNRDASRRPLNPDRLWSAGGGIRAAWGSKVQADLTVAVPLERPDLVPTLGDVRFLFSVTARLFPWRN